MAMSDTANPTRYAPAKQLYSCGRTTLVCPSQTSTALDAEHDDQGPLWVAAMYSFDVLGLAFARYAPHPYWAGGTELCR